MKNKRIMKILIALIVIVLIAFVTLTLMLPSFVMDAKKQTYEEAFEWQSEHYDTSFYDKLEKTDYTISSYDGYVLHVEFLKNPEPTTDYVIITHGYTDNMMGSLKYAWLYLDLGYNCVIYDLRGHGKNEATFTTYGIREADDLICLIDDTRERYPDITSLGLVGESLGSATSVTCLKYKPDVDFVIADCGFSDIENVLKAGTPSFLVDLADLGSRIRYHYSLKDMRPIDSLDDNTIPVLFIHGADDSLISPDNSERMAERTKGKSEFHLIPGADHAVSIITEPGMYADIVRNFLGKK